MPVDFAELQRAMGQNTQAQADFQATEDPYAYAQELRGGTTLQPDAYGQISPLQILGDMIGQSTGRRDVRNIEDERKGLSQTMAAAEAMKQNYEAEGVQQDRALKKTAEARANSAEKAEAFVNAATKEVEFLQRDPQTGNYLADGVEVNLDDYVKYEKPNTQKDTSIAYLKNNALKDLGNLEGRVNSITRSADTFKPEYAQIAMGEEGSRGLPTKFLNSFLAGTEKAGLLEYANDPNLTDQVREGMKWWSELAGEYSAQERHELFGATLTNNENKSWDDILQLNKGMTPETMQVMLASHVDRMRRRYGNKLQTWNDVVARDEEKRAISNRLGRAKYFNEIDEYGTITPMPYQFPGAGAGNGAVTPPEGGAGEVAQPKEDEQTALVQQEFTSLDPPQAIRDRLSLLPTEIQVQLMQAYIAENQSEEVVEEYGSVATSPKAKRRGQGRSTR